MLGMQVSGDAGQDSGTGKDQSFASTLKPPMKYKSSQYNKLAEAESS